MSERTLLGCGATQGGFPVRVRDQLWVHVVLHKTPFALMSAVPSVFSSKSG